MESDKSQTVPETHRLSDNRLKYLDREMARHAYGHGGLLEVLFKAKDLFGKLTPEILRYIAKSLNMAASHVYGVSTFYKQLHTNDADDASVRFCAGTTCQLHHAADISRQFLDEEDIPEEQCSFSKCMGLCSRAPVAFLNGKAILQAVPGTLNARYRSGEGVDL
jgi:NADH-quinone oxidoreductase subunit E